MSNYKYDVALSYASEDINIVKRVNKILKEEEINVFYAPDYQSKLVGKDKDISFYRVFKKESLFVALLVSKDYIVKDDPMNEAKVAMSRKEDCLIPIYLDKNVSLPGLDEDIIYYIETNEAKIADLIIEKIQEHKKVSKENTKHVMPTVSFAHTANTVTATFSKPVYSTPNGSGILNASCFIISADNGSPTFTVSHSGNNVSITVAYSGLSLGDTVNTAIVLKANSAFDASGNACTQTSYNFTYTAP